MASQHDDKEDSMKYDSDAECSIYSPAKSETNVSMKEFEFDSRPTLVMKELQDPLADIKEAENSTGAMKELQDPNSNEQESSDVETAQDVSVYSLCNSEVDVNLDDNGNFQPIFTSTPSSDNTSDDMRTASTNHHAYSTNQSELTQGSSTNWISSDPSLRAASQSTGNTDDLNNFSAPLRTHAVESLSLTELQDISIYETDPSEVEVEPPFDIQLGCGIRVVDSFEEIARRKTTNPTPILPEYTTFAWDHTKTDASEYSLPSSEIEVEFDSWRIWLEQHDVGFVNGNE